MIKLSNEAREAIRADAQHNAVGAGVGDTLRLLDDYAALEAERDALRQQLADEKALTATLREEISEHSNDLTIAYMAGGADMRQQRDKLAGLLDEVIDVVTYLDAELMKRIDAALAEVDK